MAAVISSEKPEPGSVVTPDWLLNGTGLKRDEDGPSCVAGISNSSKIILG
jgi:hypothetical protein